MAKAEGLVAAALGAEAKAEEGRAAVAREGAGMEAEATVAAA